MKTVMQVFRSIALILIFYTECGASMEKRILLVDKPTPAGAPAQFDNGTILGVVRDATVNEASGCAASRTHPGILYTLNDHAGKNEIYVLATNGTLVATYDIKGSHNTDWEDIAIGPCGADSHSPADRHSPDCIYIADTGDTGSANTLYRLEEPYFVEDRDVPAEAELRFSWSEKDCETIMVDPKGEVYLISKDTSHQGRGMLFHVPSTAWTTPGSHSHRVNLNSTAVVIAPSHHHDPVAGDISPNGNEVLVKVHEAIYYWNMNGTHSYEAIMTLPGDKAPYIQETQGESVCWDPQGNGYYTLSEGLNQPIYYYSKIHV